MRFLRWATATGLCGLAAIWFSAPQVFTLWQEGFPAPVWPATGDFVTVTGQMSDPVLLVPDRPLPSRAQSLFDDSAGRALLVEQRVTITAATYGPGIAPDTRLNSYSLVKSLIGVMVIKAVAERKISGMDASIADYLTDAPEVTVREALTMTSGLSLRGEPPKEEKQVPVDDASFSPFAPVGRLHAFGIEGITAGLDPDAGLRGRFHYQSVNTALLGKVLETVYDQPLEVILSDTIWEPAGAAPAKWRANPTTGRASAYCCLYARPLDWIKVGRFLLENGAERPFLPQDLWQDWIAPELSDAARTAGYYGWHLRHDVLDRQGEALSGPFSYFAGHDGQIVYLLPEQDTVVVRFGVQPQLLHSTLYALFPK